MRVNDHDRVSLDDMLCPLSESIESMSTCGSRLSEAQLSQVWDTGRFSVDSELFSGQEHVWELSWLLVKGRIPRTETLLDNAALVMKLLVVAVPRLLWRQRHEASFFNFVAGVTELVKCCILLPQQLFGGLERSLNVPYREAVRMSLLRSALGLPELNDDKLEEFQGNLWIGVVNAVADLRQSGFRKFLEQDAVREPVRLEEIRKRVEKERPELKGSELLQFVADEEARGFQERILQWVHSLGKPNRHAVCSLLVAIGVIRDANREFTVAKAAAKAEFKAHIAKLFPFLSRIQEFESEAVDDLVDKVWHDSCSRIFLTCRSVP